MSEGSASPPQSWISIPSLLWRLRVWLYWSIITVQMLNLGFPSASLEMFTISAHRPASPGLTLRIPSSFLIRIAGGRHHIFLTTAMLMDPGGLLLPLSLCRYGYADLGPLLVLALLSGTPRRQTSPRHVPNISSFIPRKCARGHLWRP